MNHITVALNTTWCPMTDELFNKCVRRKSRDGRHEIRCRLGLFGVEGPDREAVEREARHYWIQYFQDGEYNNHLENTQ